MIKYYLIFILCISWNVLIAQTNSNIDTCSNFANFLEKFRTNETFRNTNISYPLPYRNIAICDKHGNPKVHPAQNQKYPRQWCEKSVYSKKELHKFGPELIFPLTFLQTYATNPSSITKSGDIMIYLDNLNDCSLKAVDDDCEERWQKYYFKKNKSNCWEMVKAELFMHVSFGEH